MHPSFTRASLSETLASLRQAVRDAPASGSAHHVLGLALARRGEVREALACLQTAARCEPSESAFHLGVGEALCRQSRFEDAADAFRTALALNEACWRASDWLAYVCLVLDRLPDARAACLQSIRAHPDHDTPYPYLIRACLDGEPLDRALATLHGMLPANAQVAYLRDSIGMVLMQLGRYEEARAYLDRQIREDPTNATLLVLLGRLEHASGDRQAAAIQFARARAAGLDTTVACDEFIRYAWRIGDYPAVKQALFGERDGDGGRSPARTAAGQHILLSAGGGYGDEIQWTGIAPLLQARGARVMLSCRTPVRRLLETMRGIDGVVTYHDDHPPQYQPQTIFRLLGELEWTWEGLGSQVPYVHVPAPMTRLWRERVERGGGEFHVGLEWRSTSVEHERDPHTNRSVPVEQLGALMTTPGVTWHALHVGARGLHDLARRAPRLPLLSLSDQIDDFLDTAAAISAVDVVVTVDTSIAHVAGAQGKTTFLMLPYYPEWRWGDDGAPIVWYPSVRRFRQPRPGDWGTVLRQVARAVEDAHHEHCARRAITSGHHS